MNKYSVVEAAEILGISKEAVYNRMRRNTLETVTENGVKYVILKEEDKVAKNTHQQNIKRKKTPTNNDKYTQHLLQQIDELKERILELEKDKEKLIDEKEKLLVKSKKEVEQIYKQKDKQVKQVINLISQPLLAYMQKQNEAIDTEFEDLTPYERGLVLKSETNKWISLDEYMEQKGYSNKKIKNLTEKLKQKLGQSKYIKEEDGNIFIKRGKKIKQIIKDKD